jgi:hypothetical protein
MSAPEAFGWLLGIGALLVAAAYLEHMLWVLLALVLLGPVGLPVAYEAAVVPLPGSEPEIVLHAPLERQEATRVEFLYSLSQARGEHPRPAPVPPAAVLLGSALAAFVVLPRRVTP